MLDALSVSDPLTGLKNLRYFHARLEEACAAAARDGTPLSLLVVGLDRFEAVADRHGRSAAEQVLAEAAHAVSRAVRGTDTAARLGGTAAHTGGEEFAVLLPGAGLVAAIGVGERILRAVREVRVELPEEEVRVTASAGVASTEEGCTAPGDLHARADAALESARRAGRDRLGVLDGQAAALSAARSGGGG
ncbi:MAG TPA: GGDEF domain-containing protein [Longimicrobium sp.]|jgi:diguanylate cyclase (GGDEF)-like protein